MATLLSTELARVAANPRTKIEPGEVSGRKKSAYAEFSITAVPTNADVINMLKLPAGARITDATIKCGDLGTAGTLEVGWAQNAAGDGASPSGLFSALDVNTAAINKRASTAVVPGILKKFNAETLIYITVTAAWTVTSGMIQLEVEYVMP